MPTTCFVPDSELERLLLEDVPYFDLTTELLGVGREPGGIRFASRQQTVLACTEEAVRLLEKAGCVGGKCLPSRTIVNAGQTIVDATGDAAALHRGWKVTANLLESACGIAGRTRRIVDEARRANPDISVVATRKVFPGTKWIATKAVLCGGAVPHRLGLSETVLVFDHHRTFLDGWQGLLPPSSADPY